MDYDFVELISIYENGARADFERKLNNYSHTKNIEFWNALKSVISKSGDKYGYKSIMAQKGVLK